MVPSAEGVTEYGIYLGKQGAVWMRIFVPKFTVGFILGARFVLRVPVTLSRHARGLPEKDRVC